MTSVLTHINHCLLCEHFTNKLFHFIRTFTFYQVIIFKFLNFKFKANEIKHMTWGLLSYASLPQGYNKSYVYSLQIIIMIYVLIRSFNLNLIIYILFVHKYKHPLTKNMTVNIITFK